MHVILLNGLWDWLPSRTLGPYLLRHQLEKRGHNTQVIDFCQEMTAEQIIELVEHFATEETVCLGLSTTFWQDVEEKRWDNNGGMPPNMYEVTKYVKNKYPNIKIVLGGAGVRYTSKMIEYVDAMVVGEAEDLFPEMLDHWRHGTQEPFKFRHVINRKTYYNRPINQTYKIETCDFSFIDRDALLPGETLPMETARGCIFKCKFCAFPHLGKKKFDYIKPLDYIRAQMEYNYERWGVTDYMMMDDTFNDSEYKIDTFLDMTRQLPFDLKYTAYIRADLVHRFSGQDLKLQESGLEGTIFGIESLHPHASMAVGKGWSGKHAREYVPELVHNIWQDKVNVMLGLIIGLPGENSEHLMDSLAWLNNNDLHAAWSVLQIQTPENLNAKTIEAVSFLSEFDRNYADYGYRFDERGAWHNDIWNMYKALDFQKELLSRRKVGRLNPWMAQTAKVLGYSMETLINPPVRGKYFMLSPDFIRRRDKFVADYRARLLSVKDL